MTKRLITIPIDGVGPLNCDTCDYICNGKPNEDDDDEDDEDDEDPTGNRRNWCGAFEQWIPWNEDECSERLPDCIDGEVR